MCKIVPKNLNVRIEIEPVAIGADATVYVCQVSGPDIEYCKLYSLYKQRSDILYTIASTSAVTGLAFLLCGDSDCFLLNA